jgi:hypothetical protein
MQNRDESPSEHLKKKAKEFTALTEALEEELPKLYSLTERLLDTCLHRLAQLQEALNKTMYAELRPLAVETPGSLEHLVGDWQNNLEQVDLQVRTLTICNGDLFPLRPLTIRHESPPARERPPTASGIPGTHFGRLYWDALNPVATAVCIRTWVPDGETLHLRPRPSTPRGGLDTWPARKKRLVDSYEKAARELRPRAPRSATTVTVAGLRRLSYQEGEIFLVIAQEGEDLVATRKYNAGATMGLGLVRAADFEVTLRH